LAFVTSFQIFPYTTIQTCYGILLNPNTLRC
jgi:hypothetical protein